MRNLGWWFRPRKVMKLIASFHLRQLLSIIGLICSIQTAAFAQATGNDYIEITQPAKILQNVRINGTQGRNVMVQEPLGVISYDLAFVKEVRMAPTAEFIQAQAALDAGQFDVALTKTKAVVDKFKGLPTPWAQDAMVMLGNINLSLGKLEVAELAFNELEKSYPGSASLSASLGKARLAASKKDYATARSTAAPVVAEALTKKSVTKAESQAYGMAYFILGQCAEGEKKLPEAMENYCRTVAIFYQERSVVAEAQKRVDDLRNKGITVP